MKILITGGTGMVGKNLLKVSQTHTVKHQVIAPTRKDVDLLNYHSTLDYIQGVRPDVIIHAAGKVGGIAANMQAPVEFLFENTEIGKNVIMGAKAARVPRLLNLASSCVYPRLGKNPLREEDILTGELEPTNEGYALAKILALKLCEYISKTSDLKYKTILPCNLYGEFDHFDPIKSHLLPSIIMKLHKAKSAGLKEVDIWGSGQARREFMLAEDLANIIFACLEKFDQLPNLMNVGLGKDHTINEYYERAAKVIGFTGKFVHDLSKPEGMKQKLVSVSKMESLGMKAATSLDDGIARAYAYYLKTLK